MFDALGVDAPHSAVKPAALGHGAWVRRAARWNRSSGASWRAPGRGLLRNAGLFDSLNRFVDVLNEEAVQSGFLADAVEAFLGCKLGAASAAVCDEFQLDVIVKSDPAPEGVVPAPGAAARWENAVGGGRMEYFGEGNVRLVAPRGDAGAASGRAHRRLRLGDRPEETAAMTDDRVGFDLDATRL